MKKKILCLGIIACIACFQISCNPEEDVVINDTTSGSTGDSGIDDDDVNDQT